MPKETVDLGNAQVVPREDYVAVIQAIKDAGFCPFCEEHLFKHHQKPVLVRSGYWIVTENAWPYEGAQLHFLLICLDHVSSIEELSDGAWNDFQRQYRWLREQYGFLGATLLWRSGDTQMTGASVSHLHAQIIVGSERTDTTAPIKALVGFNAQ